MKQHITIEPTEDLLTVAEVAKQLRVDPTTVRRWVDNGALEAVTLPRIGKRSVYRVKASTLQNVLEPAK